MSSMNELSQDQEEQDNESGIDMHSCYHACHPLERNEFNELRSNENAENIQRVCESTKELCASVEVEH